MQTIPSGGFPLSSQQEHLWSLQAHQGRTCKAQAIIHIEGPVNQAVLEQAFTLVVQKHEILRTTFCSIPGLSLPLQTIGEQVLIAWTYAESSGLEEHTQEAALTALLSELAEPEFDLERGPLCRVAPVVLTPESMALLIVLPALCVDLLSLQNLTRDLAQAYASLIEQQPFAQDVLQYADFSAWQAEIPQGEEADEGRRYWRQEKLSSPAHTQLPFGKQLSSPRAHTSQTLAFSIHPSLVERITALTRTYDVSLQTFLFTCWHLLLWRLSDKQLNTLSLLVDGRQYDELQLAMGLFARSIPITYDLTEPQPFVDLLRGMQKKLQEASQWQDFFQWKSIAGEIQDAAGALFYPASFDWQTHLPDVQSAGVVFRLWQQEAEVDGFDLKLQCVQTATSLQASLQYNADIFQREEISSLQESFVTLLQSALDDPTKIHERLNVLGEAATRTLLQRFSNAASQNVSLPPVTQLFEEQVARTPSAPAVHFQDQVWTYKELNSRANRLAAYLRKQGVGPEVRVGICMERSLELVVALLGVLKAGGAYVPIDPDYPESRIHFMFKDADLALVLSQQSIAVRLPETGTPIICLDNEWASVAGESEIDQASRLHPQNLAYIIYTSGSTGQPKGVLIPHQALSNHMQWMQETFKFSSADRILQKTPYSFDASVWEFYAPLLCGGVLVMAEPGKHGDPAYLLQAIPRYQVTTIQVVPSLLRVLLQTAQGLHDCPMLQRVFCGGEVLTSDLQADFFQQTTAELYNLYGPSETCIDATYWLCAPSFTTTRIPIGRPVSHVETYILDENLAPVPAGVAGELYIGGAGVGRGYHQQPALTADKFRPHPFCELAGARLYKTGDRARYRSDGVIEFLGRDDSQVKVRGFRIELGEVESALLQHPDIKNCVVVAQKQAQGDSFLVGYVSSEKPQAQILATLRQFLAARLPEYMIPGSFVFLSALPLMPNGKVDRQYLAQQTDLQTVSDTSYEAPRTVLEEILAEIWQDLLALERVGIFDNFFQIGGHSLLVTRAVARIQHDMGIELSLHNFFEAPTIAELAPIVLSQLSRRIDEAMLQQFLAPSDAVAHPA